MAIEVKKLYVGIDNKARLLLDGGDAIGENPPSRPSAFRVSSVTASSVSLAWYKQFGITGYLLTYKKADDDTWTTATAPAVGAATATISGLSATTAYIIRLRSVSSGGTSIAAVVTATTT
jgi:hypothetical protein